MLRVGNEWKVAYSIKKRSIISQTILMMGLVVWAGFSGREFIFPF